MKCILWFGGGFQIQNSSKAHHDFGLREIAAHWAQSLGIA